MPLPTIEQMEYVQAALKDMDQNLCFIKGQGKFFASAIADINPYDKLQELQELEAKGISFRDKQTKVF